MKEDARKTQADSSVEEECDNMMGYLEDEPAEGDESILDVGYQGGHGQGWIRLPGAVDSGAPDFVAGRVAVPHVPVRPSVGYVERAALCGSKRAAGPK